MENISESEYITAAAHMLDGCSFNESKTGSVQYAVRIREKAGRVICFATADGEPAERESLMPYAQANSVASVWNRRQPRGFTGTVAQVKEISDYDTRPSAEDREARSGRIRAGRILDKRRAAEHNVRTAGASGIRPDSKDLEQDVGKAIDAIVGNIPAMTYGDLIDIDEPSAGELDDIKKAAEHGMTAEQIDKLNSMTVAGMPDFYAAWLVPSENSAADELERMKGIRSETFHSLDEITKWIADNKREGDVVIPPVKYSASERGVYEPESGKKTGDSYFPSVKPYRQHVMPRFKQRTAAQQRRLEMLITNVLERVKARRKWHEYDVSGRREELAKSKTGADKALSRENSRRRAKLRDDICREFYPELFDQWKNGETKAIRDAASQELATKLDFTRKGDPTADKMNAEWRNFYDRFAARRQKALESIRTAMEAGDKTAAEKALAEYNQICAEFQAEATNGDPVIAYRALDVNSEFQPKTYGDFETDMQNMHDGKLDESKKTYTRKQLVEAITYWKRRLCQMNENAGGFEIVRELRRDDGELDNWLVTEQDLTENWTSADNTPIACESIKKAVKVMWRVLEAVYGDTASELHGDDMDEDAGEYFFDMGEGAYEFMKAIPAGSYEEGRQYADA